MRRPLPTVPRGPRRPRRPKGGPTSEWVTCPRVSPQWELDALRALMKPHEWTRGAVEHRSGEQAWLPAAGQTAEDAVRSAAQRLGIAAPPTVHLPEAGELWMAVEVGEGPGGTDFARALALVLSKTLPGLWFTVGRLFVREGRFYRRRRDNTFKFRLLPATDVHLPRPVRAALRGLL